MSDLPAVSARELIKALQSLGFVEVRQKGSHRQFRKDGVESIITVPMHGNKSLKTGTLRAIIKATECSIDDFIAALR